MLRERPEAILARQLRESWGVSESRARWLATARPEQLTPPGDWRVWLICAGRGFGKTRSGAEDAADYGQTHPGSRIAVVGAEETWNRSLGELILTNGTRYKLFSAEEPERLRGPQHHRGWCEELGAWKYQQATWDQLAFGLRLGPNPQIVVTTTPRPTKLIKALAAAPTTYLTRGSTFDNAANLAPIVLEQLQARYGGTRIGRQELEAEILEDVAGALWTRDMIEDCRVDVLPTMQRIVVGVDPSGSDGETGDCQGIVVCGVGTDGRGYVLEDCSLRGSPETWGRAVANAYHRHKADRIVAERNFGGAMVESVIRAADPNLPVTLVTASRGKAIRAEPVASLYEQKRVSHLGTFPELEDQLVQMTPGGWTGPGSPDRLDAMVWAFSDLVLTATDGAAGFVEYARRQIAAQIVEPELVGRTVAMTMPADTTSVDIGSGEGAYLPGSARQFFAHPDHVRALEGVGCRRLETA